MFQKMTRRNVEFKVLGTPHNGVREDIHNKKSFLTGIARTGLTPSPRAGQRATWFFFSDIQNDI